MEAKLEVGALLRGTAEVISSTPAGSVGYVVGFFVLLVLLGWQPVDQ